MWKFSAPANGVAACAYLVIAVSLAVRYLRSRGAPGSRFALAGGLVFIALGVDRGARSLRMLLPVVGVYERRGGEAREIADEVPLLLLASLVTGAGLYYWSFHRRYGMWLPGANRFRDLRSRRRHTLDNADSVIQGLVVAQTANDLNERKITADALTATLKVAREIVRDLLDTGGQAPIEGGDLRRVDAVSIERGETRAAVPVRAKPAAGAPVWRVVLVDDSDDVRLLVQLLLHNDGRFDVVGEASNGLDGIEVVSRLQPDVVLLDVVMPVMDGLEALPVIVAETPKSKVIILSGFEVEAITSSVLALGASAFVPKTDLSTLLIPRILEVIAPEQYPARSVRG